MALVRKNNDFAEFKVHLIHRKQVPLLHNTVMILCDEGAGLVAMNNSNIICDLWPRGYKTFFMLNSTEHEISTAHKTKILTNKEVSCFKSLRCCIYHADKCLNANNCVSRINFVLS